MTSALENYINRIFLLAGKGGRARSRVARSGWRGGGGGGTTVGVGRGGILLNDGPVRPPPLGRCIAHV